MSTLARSAPKPALTSASVASSTELYLNALHLGEIPSLTLDPSGEDRS